MNLVAIMLGVINPLLSIPLTVFDFVKRRKPFLCSVIIATAIAYVSN